MCSMLRRLLFDGSRAVHTSCCACARAVLLRQSVGGLGEAGDVREVAAGYARNCLLPRRLAEPATPARRAEAAAAAAERAAAALARTHAAAGGRAHAELDAVVAALTRSPLVVRAVVDKARPEALHEPLGAARLSALVARRRNIHLPVAAIELAAPIAVLGEHSVPLRVEGRPNVVLRVLVKRRL